MQEETLLPQQGTTVPSDEILKLQCLQMAMEYRAIDVIGFAKEMYEWVKEDSRKLQPDAEKWNIKSDEVKYSYDLTKISGDKTVVAENNA